MKKLLAVATIGLVGYVVVKKIRERKNNEVEVNDIIEKAEELVNEEVVGKAVNDNIEGVAKANNDDEVFEAVVGTFIELAVKIYVLYLGYKFYKLMIDVGIIKGCKIMLEKVAAYIIATLSVRGFRYLALGE